jgi:hypothetical protein
VIISQVRHRRHPAGAARLQLRVQNIDAMVSRIKSPEMTADSRRAG